MSHSLSRPPATRMRVRQTSNIGLRMASDPLEWLDVGVLVLQNGDGTKALLLPRAAGELSHAQSPGRLGTLRHKVPLTMRLCGTSRSPCGFAWGGRGIPHRGSRNRDPLVRQGRHSLSPAPDPYPAAHSETRSCCHSSWPMPRPPTWTDD